MKELLTNRSFWALLLVTDALLAYLAWQTYDARRSK